MQCHARPGNVHARASHARASSHRREGGNGVESRQLCASAANGEFSASAILLTAERRLARAHRPVTAERRPWSKASRHVERPPLHRCDAGSAIARRVLVPRRPGRLAARHRGQISNALGLASYNGVPEAGVDTQIP